jgi:hypothetical protein
LRQPCCSGNASRRDVPSRPDSARVDRRITGHDGGERGAPDGAAASGKRRRCGLGEGTIAAGRVFLPAGIDAAALVAAIEAKLRAGGRSQRKHAAALDVLERSADGKIVVSRIIVERLGDDVAEIGE